MPCIKIVHEAYMNTDAAELLIHQYVFRKAVAIGGRWVDPMHAAEEMKLVKQIWRKDVGRQVRHFVLCFNEKESARVSSAGLLQLLGYRVCEFYQEYQIVFGVHQSRCWHIHFVMNTVNFRTGQKFPCRNEDDQALGRHIEALLGLGQIPIYYR